MKPDPEEALRYVHEAEVLIEQEMERQRRWLKRIYPFAIALEFASGVLGVWSGSILLIVSGFGWALYLWFLRRVQVRLGRWP